MEKKEFHVIAETGIHARPATLFGASKQANLTQILH